MPISVAGATGVSALKAPRARTSSMARVYVSTCARAALPPADAAAAEEAAVLNAFEGVCDVSYFAPAVVVTTVVASGTSTVITATTVTATVPADATPTFDGESFPKGGEYVGVAEKDLLPNLAM